MDSLSLINQPPHFFGALFTIVSFVTAVFTKNESLKKVAHVILYIGYVAMLVTGISLFIKLPISIFVLIKSVGGIGLIVMAEILVRRKGGASTLIIWTLLLVTAAAGLTIAYFFI